MVSSTPLYYQRNHFLTISIPAFWFLHPNKQPNLPKADLSLSISIEYPSSLIYIVLFPDNLCCFSSHIRSDISSFNSNQWHKDSGGS